MVIIKALLNANEINHYREQLYQTKWLDGKKTAQGIAAEVKSNSQADSNDPKVKALAKHLLAKMGSHNQVVGAALPHKIFPPCFNRYAEQETYGYHVDAAIMRLPNSQSILRSDVSTTVFLSEKDEYEGGELTITTDFGTQTVKLNAGDAVVYPSSSLHCVTPVTKGTRLAAICWIQSLIADSNLRKTLYELDQTIQSLAAKRSVDRKELDQLHHVYHNLIRQFSQV